MAECEASPDGAQIVLRNEDGELDRLAPFVEDYARQAGLAAYTVFAIQLCLDEAVSNIVRHGEGRASHIVIRLRSAGGRADLMIADDGSAFDPTSAPPPQRATSLDEAQIGGLGVHLMRKFSSAMRYERAGAENRLLLSFGPASDAGAA